MPPGEYLECRVRDGARGMSVRWLVLFCLAGCGWVHAQEVRRAIPVGPGSLENYDNPSWMEHVNGVGEVEVRRALPVDSGPSDRPTPAVPVEQPTVPTPVESIDPVEAVRSPETTAPEASAFPVATPISQDAPVVSGTTEDGIIRIAPAVVDGGTDSALGRANSLFARGLYDLAIPEYEVFLVSGAKSEGRDAALFRLAESHRALGNAGAARAALEKLVLEFQSGEFAAAGAYRLGGILFAEKMHDAAAAQFDVAAREAKDAGVRLSSAYFSGRSHEAAGRIIDAANRYEAVLSASGENVYRDNAAMALGGIQLKRREKRAALKTFRTLANASAENDVAASAAMEAAGLAAEVGNNPVALEMLEIAARKGESDVRAGAVLQSLLLRYRMGDHAGVVAAGRDAAMSVPNNRRDEALSILAASLRETGDNAGAAAVYGEMLSDGDAGTSAEVRYQRLLALHAAQDMSLLGEIDAFVGGNPDRGLAASATLLKAEVLFKQGNHAGAAVAYAAAAENTSLKEEQRPAALYKNAWSLAAAGDTAGAVAAYDAFLRRYPRDRLAAGALLQSGMARQKMQDYEGALVDFNRVLKEYPLSAEVELALLQKALTCGQLKRNGEMDSAFRELLEKYPKTGAAAQAHFWIGWVAYENDAMEEAVKRLSDARRLDGKTYGERSTLRIILAHYHQQDFAAALSELDGYNGAPLPPEVLVWLAREHATAGNHARVEEMLKPLLDGGGAIPPDAWLLLAGAREALGAHDESADAAMRYLAAAEDPPSRARGHMARARALLGGGRLDEARRDIEQALFLQPEGKLNAEARLLSGEAFFATGDYDSAARSFMAVSVLTDDPEVTPRALRRAADAYLRTFNDAEAGKALEELRQRFPASPLSAGA